MRFPPSALLPLLAGACAKPPTVVVYCAADQEHAEPILQEFGKRTGIAVDAKFDIEAAKTVGLARTLEEEKDHPRCDVFWNNEILHTIRLKEARILAPYRSPSAEGIPPEFVDPEGFWTGFAARARVFIVNTNRVRDVERPKSIRELADPHWKGQVGLAKPTAGTALTHFAALFEVWGEEKTREFCEALLANEVNLASGNGPVASLVGGGHLIFGLTDTDDVRAQQLNGKPVAAVYPDEPEDGVLVIPNTLALVAGAPHAENGKKLIDYLLSPAVERRLAASPSANIPVRPTVETPEHVRRLDSIRRMEVDWVAAARNLPARVETLSEIFVR
ncbi:MAG TPA: extracellular solute-binding protein [Planctomycetota bacterium]|jgi:iron(III) transport system substrate-binding protein|nr:extracellular solute-binding protein [Planctomycetota bacterium]